MSNMHCKNKNLLLQEPTRYHSLLAHWWHARGGEGGGGVVILTSLAATHQPTHGLPPRPANIHVNKAPHPGPVLSPLNLLL